MNNDFNKELNIERDSFWHSWLSSTSDFVFIKDLDGKYLAVSKTTAEMFGFDDISEITGKTDMELFPKEMAESFAKRDKDVINNKTKTLNLDWVDHPKLGKILIETASTPILNSNNEVIGVQGISRDITEQNILNTKIQEQQAQLNAILDNIPLAIWLKDIKGNYIAINKAYEEFYEVKKEDLINKSVMETLDKEALASSMTIKLLIAADMHVIRSKEVLTDEVTMQIHGQPADVEIIKAPICDADGKVAGLIGISRNVTDKNKYEKLLRQSKDDAEEASKAKSEFLANMSHEIRTPMNGIMGFIQLLSETNLDDEQKDFVQEAQKSSEILLKILNDILDLSKLEAGKMSMEHISFNVRYLMEDVGTLASANAAKKENLEINVLSHADVPQKVFGDPGRLKQVLNNLVNNAIKFTPEGEVNLTVKLANKTQEKAKLLFIVQDTGIGISKENQNKIFNSFTQADNSTTRKYGGTGLGLTISKNIIEAMNGEIKLDSDIGKGSIFTFSAEFDIDNNGTEEDLSSQQFGQNMNILVVDDNRTNLKVIEYYLNEYNCSTTMLDNPKSALDKIKSNEQHFDLILSDFCMPDMSGIELAQKIKEIPTYQNTPIILLTSRAKIGDYKMAKDNNLSGYLPKPVRKNDLIACLNLIYSNKKDFSNPELITRHTIEEVRFDKKIKILIAEDNEVNQKFFSKMFSKLNLVFDIANDGELAVKAYQENGYDLIFMDCQMPVMNGFEATKRIRELQGTTCKKPVIIALTASASEEAYKKCIDAGMDDYLSKPINNDILIEKIKKHIKVEETTQHTPELETLQYELEGVQDYKTILNLISSEIGIDIRDSKELLDEFLSDINLKLNDLKIAIDEHKFDTIVSIAHYLKGSSGNLRIDKIYQCTKTLEEYGDRAIPNECLKLFNQLTMYVTSLTEGKNNYYE